MPELHPYLQALVNNFGNNIVERQTNKHTEQLDLGDLVNHGFEGVAGNPHKLTHYPWLPKQGRSIQNKAIFNLPPTPKQITYLPGGANHHGPHRKYTSY